MNGEKKKRIVYWVFAAGLLIFCGTYVPYLMDYYMLQPDTHIWTFYLSDVLNPYYRFEGIAAALFMMAVWLFTGKAGVAVSAMALPYLLLAYASLIKYKARGELLRLSDLSLSGAFGVAVKYLELQCAPAQILVVACLAILIVCGVALDRQQKKLWGEQKRSLRFVRMVAGVCSVGILIGYVQAFFAAECSIENVSAMNIARTDYDRYVLYQFLKDDDLGDINLNHLEESYQFFRENSQEHPAVCREQYPNVIVIMNESWWNTDNMLSDQVTFSKDPMEPYKKLAESGSGGYLTANIYGGGTFRSEIEFLTGLNTKYAGNVYGELLEGDAPNVFDYFRALDYETYMIHPYYGEFYSRKTMYSNIGVDNILFEEDMDYRDIYSMYISDASLARQIIQEYENRGKQNCFMYAVSVANHNEVLDYSAERVEDYPYPISVEVKDDSVSESDLHVLVNYVNGIYYAGEAFAQLTDYFSRQEEPTVIVMYGDHSPGFSEEVLSAMGLGDRDKREVQKSLYSVPVLMWSNYDSEEVRFEGENISYLPQIVLEYAKLPEADMTEILNCERRFFKTDTLYIVENPDGSPVEACSREQIEAMQHYKVIAYGILSGYERCKDVWIPHAIE